MAIDPDAVLKERTDRIEKSIDELRREMNTNYNHLRSEVIAVETRISNEFSSLPSRERGLKHLIGWRDRIRQGRSLHGSVD